MKKMLSFGIALCLFFSSACFAAEVEVITGSGISVIPQNHHEETDSVILDITYPVFQCDNSELQAYLTETVTDSILALGKDLPVLPEMSRKNEVSMTYQAGLEQESLFSVYAIRSIKPGDGSPTQYTFFSKVILLTEARELSLSEIFQEDEENLFQTLRELIISTVEGNENLLSGIRTAEDIPIPDHFALIDNALCFLFSQGTLFDKDFILSISYDHLQPFAVADFTAISEETVPQEEYAEEAEELPVQDPEEDEQGESEASTTTEFSVSITEETTEPQPAPTLDPNFSLPDVVTPTPMPMNLNDSEIMSVLAHGLWKPLGSDGTQYYQFMEDGKLLVISVENFTLENGKIISDSITGHVDVGSDSAFTLEELSGKRIGFVLNRQGDSVAPEEFVTPSPTPVPTPTPSPTPEATPTPTPSPTLNPTDTPAPTATPVPTPSPTPTLSPYQLAEMTVPRLEEDTGAEFRNRRTLKVYHAPSEDALQIKGANVTTDETVVIFGQENDWLLVSYEIGNGSRGRIAYISNSTLNPDKPVQELRFASFPMVLTKKAEATDDPLRGRDILFTLNEGDSVTLLAFYQQDWVYVETTYKEKVCRVFIPVTSIQQ